MRRTLAIVALLAVAVWLGGLAALGAVAAPVVFSTVPWPSSADAMSIVFRRFDAVAMACAAIVLSTEAIRAVAGQGMTSVMPTLISAGLGPMMPSFALYMSCHLLPSPRSALAIEKRVSPASTTYSRGCPVG